MNDEHSSEHSDIISRDDGYSPDVVPAMDRTINGHVYTEAQYQQMCAEHPMYYVDRNPTGQQMRVPHEPVETPGTAFAQVGAENEQLRTLVARSLVLLQSMSHTIQAEYNHCNEDWQIDEMREQAKTLGIEVQE